VERLAILKLVQLSHKAAWQKTVMSSSSSGQLSSNSVSTDRHLTKEIKDNLKKNIF